MLLLVRLEVNLTDLGLNLTDLLVHLEISIDPRVKILLRGSLMSQLYLLGMEILKLLVESGERIFWQLTGVNPKFREKKLRTQESLAVCGAPFRRNIVWSLGEDDGDDCFPLILFRRVVHSDSVQVVPNLYAAGGEVWTNTEETTGRVVGVVWMETEEEALRDEPSEKAFTGELEREEDERPESAADGKEAGDVSTMAADTGEEPTDDMFFTSEAMAPIISAFDVITAEQDASSPLTCLMPRLMSSIMGRTGAATEPSEE